MKTAISALALAAVLATGAAEAADLPSRRAPPPAYLPPPPVLTWNGPYAGINLGGGWQDAASSNVWNPAWAWGGPGVGPNWGWGPGWGWNGNGGGSGGVVGGGQIGYNFQFSPWLVAGVETDFQGTTIGSGGGNNGWNGWGGGVDAARLNWFGTVRGRLGVTFPSMSNLMIYGTGGFAYGDVQRNFTWSNYSVVQTGWTAGAGVEWLFLPNWSAKAEYLYTEISGNQQNFWWNPGFSLNNVNNRTRFHTIRAGLNYHFNLFNGPAPVMARY